jgi:hypothetical protein
MPDQFNSDNQNSQPQFLIGPDMPTDPTTLLDEARTRIKDEDAKNKESVKLARRLFIAMILITVLGIGFYIIMPYYGVRLPAIVPILSFIAIFVGAIMSAIEESKTNAELYPSNTDDPDSCSSDGCAMGMCPGPRPLQMFRDKKPPRSS